MNTETIEYKGHRIEIFLEDDVSNSDPRDMSNAGVMECFHSRYNLGDQNTEHKHKADEFGGWAEFHKHLVEEHGALEIAQLFLYDHSGLRMKIGSFMGLLPQGHAEFDSGPVGFIYATRETIEAMHGKGKLTKKKLALVRQNLEAEVAEYDAYLAGQVYGYRVLAPKPEPCKSCGHVEDRETEESCGGFLGWDGDKRALAEAKSQVDYIVKRATAPAAKAKKS